MSLDMISLPQTNCSECLLVKQPSIKHNYRGHKHAKYMFIGSAPGIEEQKTGEVYRGRGGQLQSRILEHIGIVEDVDTFMTNIIMCSPDTPGDPAAAIIKCCQCNLEAQIEQVQPKLLIPIGNPAMKAICGKTGITRWSGMLIDSKFGIPAIPIIQPASALRQGAEVDEDLDETQNYTLIKIINDLKFAKHHVDTGSQTRQDIKREVNHLIVKERKELDYVFDCMRKAELLAVDIETTGTNFWLDDIIGICISWAEKVGVYIPILVLENDLPDWHPIKHMTQTVSNLNETFLDKMKRIKNQVNSSDTKEIYESRYRKNVYRYWGNEHFDVISELREILNNPTLFVTNQNIKFDLKFLQYHWDIKPVNIAFDTMYGSYLLDENGPRGLKENSYTRYPDLRGYADELFQMMKKDDIEDESYANLPLSLLGKYGCNDGDATFRLTQDQSYEIQNYNKEKGKYKPDLSRFMWDFMVPMTVAYTEMELRGVTIDPIWCDDKIIVFQKEADELSKEIYKQAQELTVKHLSMLDSITCDEDFLNSLRSFALSENPIEFNIGSYKQLGQVLFDFIGIEPPPKNDDNGKEIKANRPFWAKTGPSTSKEPMKWYAERHPFCRSVIDWRNKVKNISTYFTGFRVINKTGESRYLPGTENRVSYTYRFDAVTGRIRCSKIPIQTVPRDPRCRGIIIPASGKILVEWDWSMAELRLIAWYAQDKVMLDELDHNVDLHKATASMTYKVAVDEVTKAMRKKAKGMNFGAWYGGGDDRLASNINEKLEDDEERITPEEVSAIRRLLFHKYNITADYIEYKDEQIKRDGYSISCFGRVRRVPQVFSKESKKDAEDGVREAFNSDVQGAASDVNQFSLIDFYRLRHGIAPQELINRLPNVDGFTTEELVDYLHMTGEDNYPMFTVHDSQIWEYNSVEEMKVWSQIQFHIMANPPHPIDIPTPVEMKVLKERWGGSNWEFKNHREFLAKESEMITHFEERKVSKTLLAAD